MAQSLEKTDPVDRPRGPAKVVPLTAGSSISPHETQFHPTSRIESWEEQVSRAVASAAQLLRPAYDQTRVAAGDACIYALDQSLDVARRVRNRAQQIKREHPLELLYGITAGAFVLGMAIRIWRSKSHEYRG
jgi:hypothetical protein